MGKRLKRNKIDVVHNSEVINGEKNEFLKILAAILRPCKACSNRVLSPFINFRTFVVNFQTFRTFIDNNF